MAKRLEYEIGVDASKGVSGLKQFSDAVKKVDKEISALEKEKAELQVTADTTEATKQIEVIDKKLTALQKQKAEIVVEAKVAKAISAIEDVAEESKRAAAAAEALGRALGPELAGKANLDGIVGDLRQMDLTFEQITANADKFGATLRSVESQDPGRLSSGLNRTKQGIDDVGKSADSSKSVLANMVGNATQDLGALGGVAGSVGVAIGQMGEYMADAAGGGEKLGKVIQNFVKVAGPIAGIALAVGAVTAIMGEGADRTEDSAKAIEDWTKALEGGGDASTKFAQQLQETGKIMVDTLDVRTSRDNLKGFGAAWEGLMRIFGKGRENLEDISPLLDRIGFTAGMWTSVIEDGARGEERFTDAVEASNLSTEDKQVLLEALTDQQVLYNEALEAGERNERIFAKTTEELNDAIMAARDPLTRFGSYWDLVMGDLRDGRVDAQQTTDVVNFLARTLDLTADEVIALAQAELDAADATDQSTRSWRGWGGVVGDAIERAKELGKAQEEIGIAARDMADEFVDAQRTLNEMATPFSEMERREGALETAFDLGDAGLNAQKTASDVQVAMHDLFDFMSETGLRIKGNVNEAIDDWLARGGNIDTAPFLSKVSTLRDAVQAKVGEAFAAGGEDKARAAALTMIAEITKVMGGRLTAQQVAQITGLDQFEFLIDVALDEESVREARGMLQLLAGLPGADPLYVAQIQLALAADELSEQAASVLLAEKLGEFGLKVPTDLLPADPADLLAARAEADAFVRNNPLIFDSAVATPDPEEAHRQAQIIAEALKIAFPSLVQNPTNTGTVLRDEQRNLNQHPLVIPVQYKITDRNPLRLDSGGTAPSGGGVAGERGPEIINGKYLTTGPTYVPPGTKVTSRRQTAVILRNGGTSGLKRYDQGGIVPAGPVTINFNGVGSIGNRYDLMRGVDRALRDRARLLGTRR